MTSAKPLGYRPSQTALEAAAARAAWRLAVLKRVVRILVVVILCIVSTVAALIWWDWRTDDLARQWIDGPHTDPISFIHINGGTPTGRLDVTLKDPGTLRALDQALKNVAAELDHSLLNDHAGLESPTLEALCLFFSARLGSAFPALCRIVVSRPTVGESCVLAL